MILIIAGREIQARVCARERELHPREWRYVFHRDHMMGMRGAKVIFYGSWRDRDDAQELYLMTRICGMEDIS